MENIGEIPPLLLAYLGDSVMEVLVREEMLKTCATNGECNKKALSFVTAKAQRDAAKLLSDRFSEAEKEVFTRAKNAKSHYVPRNCDLYTYRLATGLEAVFGFNHLSGNDERNRELFKAGFADQIVNAL